MSNYDYKDESDLIDVTCPKCEHGFSVSVTAEAEVETDQYIKIKITKD